MRLGETLLKCDPFAYAVYEDYQQHVCDFCLLASESLRNCSGCQRVKYCGPNCQRPAWNQFHREECKYIKELDDRKPNFLTRLTARVILKLRAGGAQESVTLPDGRSRRFQDLVSHADKIRHDRSKRNIFIFVYRDLERCFKESVPPKEEAFQLFCRILINYCNITNEIGRARAVGLYLEGSAIDHSCSPNFTAAYSGKTLSVRPITGDPNLRFEDARIQYVDVHLTTAARRAELRQKYYFECACAACESDPGGLDLLKQNSMRCPKCQSAVYVGDDVETKCPTCPEVLDAPRFKALKAKVVADIIENKEEKPKSELDKLVVQYANDMFEAMFHPYDRVYFDVLQMADPVQRTNEDWEGVLKTLSETLIAYKGLLPKYSTETGLVLRRLGVAATELKQPRKAEEFFLEALRILVVTHGKDNPLFVEVFSELPFGQAIDN